MKLEEVATTLDGIFLIRDNHRKDEVWQGCGCDLMSDVLAFIKREALLLTGLTNAQVIRTAEMADIPAICFVRGKRPNQEVMAMAENRGITLLATDLPLFEACGRLYRKGLAGCSEVEE